tara:strand:- start:1432 stop:2151 length:720 start_codon:yes stop_codon:yes gene_type:complete
MQYDIILTILLVTIVQSIFGVGILLFGTPLVMLIGYDFQQTLIILLPISVLVNLFQIYNKINFIDQKFYRKLVFNSIPMIIIFLYLISFNTINLKPIIGIFLILIGINKIVPFLNEKSIIINKYENIYLIITGIIHGITNLGGALLSAIIFSKNFSKEKTRSTIAISYLTFAIFQIITLVFFIKINEFHIINNFIYCIIGVITFFLVDKFIFLRINEERYSLFFVFLLFSTGFLIIFNN